MKRSKLLIALSLVLSINSVQVFAANNKVNNENNYTWQKTNNNWVCFKDSQKQKGWIKYDNNWYYLDPSTGVMKTGWLKDNGSWFYLSPSNGAMKTGWTNDGYDWYYLSPSNGAMKTGWTNDGYDWYYLNPSNGVMKTGWEKIYSNSFTTTTSIDGKTTTTQDYDWYYLNPNGTMKTGWLDYKGNWYYLNSNGAMKTGWFNRNNNWYYTNPSSGVMKTGWLKLSSNKFLVNNYTGEETELFNWYYLNPNGAMIYNTSKEINNSKYQFASNGIMLSDEWIGTTYINKNGQVIEAYPSMCHSTLQYNIYKYMCNESNRESVYNRAVQLHGGDPSNTCVYYMAEMLRRNGVHVPNNVANTHQLESYLLSHGWKSSEDIASAKPGDILFLGYDHAFALMHWYDNSKGKFAPAYITDNSSTSLVKNYACSTKYFYYTK